MKIKYNESTGEIITAGFFKDEEQLKEAGFAIIDYDGELGDLAHFTVEKGEVKKLETSAIEVIEEGKKQADEVAVVEAVKDVSKKENLILLLCKKVGITNKEIEAL